MAKRTHSDMASGGNLLSSMLSSMSKTNESARSAQQAEARTERVAAGRGQSISVDSTDASPDTALGTFLQELQSEIAVQAPGAVVEVELRFGRITSRLQETRCRPSQDGVNAAIALTSDMMKASGARFAPGVAENWYPVFEKRVHQLWQSGSFGKHTEKQVSRTLPNSQRIIEMVDADTNMKRPPQLQTKQRVKSLDIFLPHCPFDCRLSVSIEYPMQDLSDGTEELPAAESVRHKDRESAVGRDLRIDLTKVKEEHSNSNSFEVEVELNDRVVNEWLEVAQDPSEGWKAANQAGAHLWRMVKFFMPEAGQAFQRSWSFNGSDQVRESYEDRLNTRGKFGGTMPVGFARWHIPLVKRKEYFVSEKTDGVRYFLVVAAGNAVLVDRSNNAFTASGLDLLSLLLPEGTVLDGEFVFHQGEKRFVFLAFDIIATGNAPDDSHVDKSFAERLRILNDFLSENGPYATGMQSHGLHRHAVLPLLRKKWFPLKQLAQVFQLIQSVKKRDGSLARIYRDGKREHYTDGVIFCPNSRYVSNTHSEYLKWKWSDLITVDFTTYLQSDGTVSLSCPGPKHTTISLDSIVKTDPSDHAQLQKVVSQFPSSSAVIEYAFDVDKGMWRYKCVRPDKDVGNYINTVLGSVMNIAEGISEEELQFRLLREGGDKWNDHMKGMRRSLLDQHR